MKRYGVFNCYYCGAVQFCDMTQKTHRCPNEACRKLLLLGRVVVHAETDDVATAIAYLQRLKALKGVQRSGLFVSAAEMLHNTDKP